MSLLLDALKKAEAAKRRKQEGASASPLPATTSPASTETVAESAPAPDLPAPTETAMPDYPSLSLEDVVDETATAQPEAPANPEPEPEPGPGPEPTATPAKPDLPELRFELLPQPPAEPVDAPPAAHSGSSLLTLDAEHASSHDSAPATPTSDDPATANTQAIAEPMVVAPTATPASPPPTEPARPSEPVRAAPAPIPAAPLMPPAARSEAPPAQLSPEAARQLFDSKQKTQRSAPSPGQRLALIAGVGVVGLLAAGGWLWWQTRDVGSFSPAAAVLPAPAELTDPTTAAIPAASESAAPTGTEAAVAAAAVAAPTAAAADTPQPPAAAPPPSSGPQSVLPAAPLQPLPAALASTGQPTPTQTAVQAALPVTPKPGDRAQVVELPAGLAAPDVRFVRDNPPPSIARNVAQGFEAFQQGDYGRAAELYRAQLQQDSRNRDALLGLAAVAVKRNQLDEARNLYRRLLANDPKDALAATALLSLSNDGDTDGNEGRLKAAEASQPSAEAATAVAGLLARQGRWREAQEYYFKAHAAAPAEPDYAYNLAVALDALGEARLASQYYDTALKLRGSKPGSFNPDVVRQRLQTLEAH